MRHSAKVPHTTLRRWLPAILGAMAIHIVIGVVFFMNIDNKNVDEKTSSITSGLADTEHTLTPIVLETLTDNTKAEQRPPLMTGRQGEKTPVGSTTIDPAESLVSQQPTDGNTWAAKTPQALPAAKNPTTAVTSTPARPDIDVDINIDTNGDALEVSSDTYQARRDSEVANTDISGSTVRQRQPSDSTLPTRLQSMTPQSTMQMSSEDGKIVMNQSALLLPTDAPAAALPKRNTNIESTEQYHDIAEETEQINNQLSAVISQVKAKNMQQIVLDEQRAIATHRADNERLQSTVDEVSEQLDIDRAAESEFE